jgi:hypothetical protein
MKASTGRKGRTKFEEDIKGPFLSLYSFSTTVAADDDETSWTLGKVSALFPDLGGKLERFRPSATLSAVRGFTAREVVVTGGRLQLGRTPKVEAESALIIWYDEASRRSKPVAVELSFRYGDQNGNYGGGLSRRAFEVFATLQTRLKKWVDPNPRTKTALVYG